MEKEKIEQEEKPEVLNPIHKLVKKLQENRTSLYISRIPGKTKEAFKEFADNEFCGDYGMALKWLIDDVPNQDIKMIIAKIEEQESRICALESDNKNNIKEEGETRTMCDGTKRKVKNE